MENERLKTETLRQVEYHPAETQSELDGLRHALKEAIWQRDRLVERMGLDNLGREALTDRIETLEREVQRLRIENQALLERLETGGIDAI